MTADIALAWRSAVINVWVAGKTVIHGYQMPYLRASFRDKS